MDEATIKSMAAELTKGLKTPEDLNQMTAVFKKFMIETAWTAPSILHETASFRSCLKGFWTLTPDSIVKHLDLIKYIRTGHFSCFIDPLFNSFLLQAAKK